MLKFHGAWFCYQDETLVTNEYLHSLSVTPYKHAHILNVLAKNQLLSLFPSCLMRLIITLNAYVQH